MADTDSFISEVSEEVRRDRLFGFFRRWGWLAALVVVLLVGGATFFEIRRAQEQRAAEAFGNSVLQALDTEDSATRRAALEEISPETPGAAMLLAMLISGQESEEGDADAAAARLRDIAGQADLPERYRDLALFKAHLLSPEAPAEAEAMLDRLAQPGAPFRALAIEQRAYMMIENDDIEGGLALLEELQGEAGVSLGLQQRITRLIVALEAGVALIDAPVAETEPEAATDEDTTDEADDASEAGSE